MSYIKIYGFGSFFKRKADYNDIDLLFVHSDTSKNSISFAIQCKSILSQRIRNTDIVLLSENEEIKSAFIDKSNACYILKINQNNMISDIEQLIETIQSKIDLFQKSTSRYADEGRHPWAC